MLHGNPTWSFYYRHLIDDLRDSYRVIVPDHIGCGLSDKPDDSRYDYTLASRVDDLEALLDHLGLDRELTLVLHDWGGIIGMTFAARHPERIARLVVCNTAAFHKPAGKSFPWALSLFRDSPLGAWLVRGLNLFVRGTTWIGCKTRRMPREVRDAYAAPYDSWANRIAIHRFVQDIPLRPGDRSYDADLVGPGSPPLAGIDPDADRLGHEGLRLRRAGPRRMGAAVPRGGGPSLPPGRAPALRGRARGRQSAWCDRSSRPIPWSGRRSVESSVHPIRCRRISPHT